MGGRLDKLCQVCDVLSSSIGRENLQTLPIHGQLLVHYVACGLPSARLFFVVHALTLKPACGVPAFVWASITPWPCCRFECVRSAAIDAVEGVLCSQLNEQNCGVSVQHYRWGPNSAGQPFLHNV